MSSSSSAEYTDEEKSNNEKQQADKLEKTDTNESITDDDNRERNSCVSAKRKHEADQEDAKVKVLKLNTEKNPCEFGAPSDLSTGSVRVTESTTDNTKIAVATSDKIESRSSDEKNLEINSSVDKTRNYDGQLTNNAGAPSDLSTGSRARDVVEGENKADDNTAVVADHYNALEEKGLSQRFQSRIFYMRNFNNWIKSMLINDFLRKIKQNANHGARLRVLDMCCGKGGDLLKWQKANISHLICADIAETSISQCESRYKENFNRKKNERGSFPMFTAEFIAADCTKVRLREKYKDPSLHLDLVSCQFALHYSFETLQQAECMMQNASESLRPGGYLIATIPDSNRLVDQWKKCDGDKFGNNVFNIEFLCDKNNIPLFGAKYHFQLESVVNCPEFLVYLPLLKKLAYKYGLDFVMFESFEDFYKRMKEEGRSLLGRMQALETYPPYHESPLLGSSTGSDYQHAVQYMQNSTGHRKIGTLSLPEWEATTLYAVVAFQKMKTTWNALGKPEYSKL